MASVTKFTTNQVYSQVAHIERWREHYGNEDIDVSRRTDNYLLSAQREMTSYDYFKQRKSELYVYNRDDVKVMAGWIVTAPKDLPTNQQDIFFQETYEFLERRYRKENVVSAVVHKDESGQPHLHFLFIPVTPDMKHGGEKICANDVLNRKELRNFHPDLQRYLNEQGIQARVMNGATANGNRTVKELKQERDHKIEHERKLVF